MAEYHLAPDDCVPRPILELNTLKWRIVDIMVQHLVRELE